jgi:hypothetical protein
MLIENSIPSSLKASIMRHGGHMYQVQELRQELLSREQRDEFQKKVIERESLKRLCAEESFWEAIDNLLESSFGVSDSDEVDFS